MRHAIVATIFLCGIGFFSYFELQGQERCQNPRQIITKVIILDERCETPKPVNSNAIIITQPTITNPAVATNDKLYVEVRTSQLTASDDYVWIYSLPMAFELPMAREPDMGDEKTQSGSDLAKKKMNKMKDKIKFSTPNNGKYADIEKMTDKGEAPNGIRSHVYSKELSFSAKGYHLITIGRTDYPDVITFFVALNP